MANNNISYKTFYSILEEAMLEKNKSYNEEE